MTAIFYKNDVLSADRQITTVYSRSNIHRSKGTKLFLNKNKSMAITITGPLPDEDELERIFNSLTIDLSILIKDTKQPLTGITRNNPYFEWVILGMTKEHTFRCSNLIGLTLMSPSEPIMQTSAIGGGLIIANADIELSEAHRLLAKFDPLVSADYDSIKRTALKPFKYTEFKNVDNAKR